MTTFINRFNNKNSNVNDLYAIVNKKDKNDDNSNNFYTNAGKINNKVNN